MLRGRLWRKPELPHAPLLLTVRQVARVDGVVHVSREAVEGKEDGGVKYSIRGRGQKGIRGLLDRNNRSLLLFKAEARNVEQKVAAR